MPMVGAAIAAYAVSAGVTAALTATIGVVAASIVGAIAGAIVSMAITAAFSDKPDQPEFQGFEQTMRDRLFTIRQAIMPWQVIYGRCRVGGALTYALTTGTDNKYLHMIITLACHEIDAIEEIWFNDEILTIDVDGLALGRYYYESTVATGTISTLVSEGLTITGGIVTTSQTLNTLVSATVTDQWSGQSRLLQSYSAQDPYAAWAYGFSVSGNQLTFDGSLEGQTVTVNYYTDTTSTEVVKASKARIQISLGDEAEGVQPFPDLVTESGGDWSSLHMQTGRAKIYVRLEDDKDLYPNGIPNITALLRGKKVNDVRVSPTVEAWTSNAALCLADYMTNSSYGLGLPYTDLDDTQLVAAANVCDESVDTDLGGSVPRYTCDGRFAIESNPESLIGKILTAMAGKVTMLGGTWWLFPAAYSTPSVELTLDDIVGPIAITPRLSRDNLTNAIKGIYVEPLSSWQATDYPPVLNSTYQAEDNGERIWREVDLPFTTNANTAQRIAKIELERTRQQITVSLRATLKAYQVPPGETLQLTVPHYGWNQKVFEVTNVALAALDTNNDSAGALYVDLGLRETAAGVFDWGSGDETVVDFAPDSALPDGFSAPAITGMTLASGTAHLIIGKDGTVISRIYSSWNAPSDAVRQIEVQWRRSGSPEEPWQSRIIAGESAFDYIVPVEDDINYDVRVRSYSQIGVRGAWAEVPGHLVVGKTAAPSDVTGFAYNHTGSATELSWNAIADLDADLYEIRLGASWAVGTLVYQGRATSTSIVPLSVGTTTLWIKALDGSGNESTTEAQLDVVVVAPFTPEPVSAFDESDVMLSWSDTVSSPEEPGSYNAERYEIRYGVAWAGSTFQGLADSTSFRIHVDWSGARTFWVKAYDHANNESGEDSVVVDVIDPDAPTVSTAFEGENVVISWTASTGGSLNVIEYEVRYGSTFGSGIFVGRVKGLQLTTRVTWTAGREFHVAAVDTRGTFGSSDSDTATVVAWGAPSVTPLVVEVKLQLSWTASVGGSLPVKAYEIRHGASFAAGTFVASTDGLSYRVPVDWTGSRTFWVAACDVNGEYGTGGSAASNITAPAAPALTTQFVLSQAELSWTEPSSVLPIEEYEIRYGLDSDAWADATIFARSKGTAFNLEVNWTGARRWFVAAVNMNGTIGADDSATMTVTPPAGVNVTAQVVDNNVLLFWSEAAATLPVVTYKIKRGAVYASATTIGNKSGGFTTVFETIAGTFTYWVAGIDSAGNEGTPSSQTLTVSQPPDFVYLADIDSTFNGTFSNSFLDTNSGYVILPVDPTETWAQHFENNGSPQWQHPLDQINDGFPIYIQPTVESGYYEEYIDYGTLIPSSKITVSITSLVIAGDPDISVRISLANEDSPTEFVDYDDVTEVFGTNFRFIKVRVTVSAGSPTDFTDLLEIQALNIRLDAKLISDAGTTSCSAGDAGGTLVTFNSTFVDVTSITVTPKLTGSPTESVNAIYDFSDVPNPTDFKILLFNKEGTRVDGDAGWQVRGY